MTLNNKELRTIERALGMIVSTANGLGKGPNGTTLATAVDMIDGTLEAAEMRAKEAERDYLEALKKSGSASAIVNYCNSLERPAFQYPEVTIERVEG